MPLAVSQKNGGDTDAVVRDSEEGQINGYQGHLEAVQERHDQKYPAQRGEF